MVAPCNACTGEGAHMADQTKPSDCTDCTSERLVKSGFFTIEEGKENCSCYPDHKDNSLKELEPMGKKLQDEISVVLRENESESKVEDDVKEG